MRRVGRAAARTVPHGGRATHPLNRPQGPHSPAFWCFSFLCLLLHQSDTVAGKNEGHPDASYSELQLVRLELEEAKLKVGLLFTDLLFRH